MKKINLTTLTQQELLETNGGWVDPRIYSPEDFFDNPGEYPILMDFRMKIYY